MCVCVFVSGFNQQLNGIRYNIRPVIGQKKKKSRQRHQTDKQTKEKMTDDDTERPRGH